MKRFLNCTLSMVIFSLLFISCLGQNAWLAQKSSPSKNSVKAQKVTKSSLKAPSEEPSFYFLKLYTEDGCESCKNFEKELKEYLSTNLPLKKYQMRTVQFEKESIQEGILPLEMYVEDFETTEEESDENVSPLVKEPEGFILSLQMPFQMFDFTEWTIEKVRKELSFNTLQEGEESFLEVQVWTRDNQEDPVESFLVKPAKGVSMMDLFLGELESILIEDRESRQAAGQTVE